MALVYHDQGVVLVGQIANLVQLGHVAVHRKHPVGNNNFTADSCRVSSLELHFEVGHVVVGIAISLGLAEADPVNNRGVVEAVADDGVLLAEKGLKKSAVGVESGRVQNSVFGVQKLR